MKTPSFLLLTLAALAAASARAGEAPAARCDAAWLEEAAKIDNPLTASIADPKSYMIAAGISKTIKFGHPELCSGSVWRQLSARHAEDSRTGLPDLAQWPAGPKAVWAAGVPAQAKLILMSNDFYARFDAKLARALAAADAALEGAAGLGLVDAAASEKTLAEQVGGASGGAVGALKPKTYAAKTGGESRLAREQVVPALRALTADGGGYGEKVLEFRREVMELTGLLVAASRSVEAAKARFGAPHADLRDMVSGLPQGFVAVDPKDAADDAKFGAALASLCGAAAPAKLDDAAARDRAALDRVDLGARNLLVVRAAELKAASEGARARMAGKTFAQLETAARMSGAIAEAEAKKNALAVATLQALAQNRDYADLDRMYHAALQRAGGDASKLNEQEKAAGVALDRLRAEAAGATTGAPDKRGVTYTRGSVERRMPGIVPDAVDANAETRRQTAEEIVRDLVRGAKEDARLKAAFAAVRGEQPADAALPPGVERPPLAGRVPAAPANAWDLASSSAAAGCGTPADLTRGKAERYALRQEEAAAGRAEETSRLRQGIEREYDQRFDEIESDCRSQEEAIRRAPRSPRETEEARRAAVEAQVADLARRCDERKARLERETEAKHALVSLSVQTAQAAADARRAEEERRAWYAEGIPAALARLKAEYLRVDSGRRKALTKAAFNDEGVNGDIEAFFQALPAGFVDDCARKLGYDADLSVSPPRFSDPRKLKDPDDGNVHDLCEVGTRLTAAIRAKMDTIAGPSSPAAPAEGEALPAPAPAAPRQRRNWRQP